MEERTAIARPVACRPTIRSSSVLLSGSVKASPSNSSSEPAVAAIRPKTVRVKPVLNFVPVKLISSQNNGHGTTVSCSSDKCLQVENESTVVYKPLAKLVSKRTITLLANMEKSYPNHHPALGQIDPCLPHSNQVHYHLRPDNSLNCCSKNLPSSETKKAIEPPKMTAAENSKEEKTNLQSLNTINKPSYDGYNWRKYGQKQVKGSEYPRSYYKCTHPNCPAKKKVEKLLDGQIGEIVYQGEHSHLKPLPLKVNTSEGERQGFVSVATGQESNYSLSNSNLNEKPEGSEGTSDNQNETEVPSSSSNLGNGPIRCDPVKTRAIRGSSASHDDSNGLNGDYGETCKGVEVEDDEPTSKRRKAENQPIEARISEEGLQDPSGVVQSSADPELIGDGFRWRKYGQKVVKGNPYPRSYYRCTGLKCNVRKHVERASDDPTAFITTYEGKHNHEMPIKNKNLVASRGNSRAALSSRTDVKNT